MSLLHAPVYKYVHIYIYIYSIEGLRWGGMRRDGIPVPIQMA
jgi:hypothetical protein